MDYIFQILLPVVTAVVGWLGAKVKTRRENKQTDLEIINSAIAPLLKSIKELTEHNRKLTGDLVEEQKKTLELIDEKRQWLAERGSLFDELDKLRKQVVTLTKEVKMLREDRENAVAKSAGTKLKNN
jgi:cell division protein FtsB